MQKKIGHMFKMISDRMKAYEKLGRAYYESVSKGEPMEEMKDTLSK